MKPLDPKIRNALMGEILKQIQKDMEATQAENAVMRRHVHGHTPAYEPGRVLEFFHSLPIEMQELIEDKVFELRKQRGEGYQQGWGNHPTTSLFKKQIH